MKIFNGQKLKEKNGDYGYIALFSTIILSAVFILLFMGMFRLATGGMTRISDKENSRKASALATTCTEYALSQIREDTDYAGDSPHPTQDNCSIGVVGVNGNNRSFSVEGEYLDYTRKFQVEAEIVEEAGVRTIQITNWEESV